jgi:exodeoxyribonuclease-1
VGNLRTVLPVAARWGLDLDAARRHAERAAKLPPLEALWREVFQRPAVAAVDVDEDLYGGFVGNEDRRRLQRLRELAPETLATRRVAFDDARLEELLFRYRARNFPQTLDEVEQARWQQHRRERLLEGAHGGLTLAAYFERIDTLAEAAIERDDERAQALLEALVDWGTGLDPSA